MKILAHRGYWLNEKEKNTRLAFERAFALGFGVETDIRDYKGRLVISHDVPGAGCMALDAFLALYVKHGGKGTLALNIKADGLCSRLLPLLRRFSVTDYFVFDMSLPEQLCYSAEGFSVFARQSEYEKEPLLYGGAKGVWMDEFGRRWITARAVARHRRARKKVCLVSPELHKRPYAGAWAEFRRMDVKARGGLLLCTDLPEKAREYFK